MQKIIKIEREFTKLFAEIDHQWKFLEGISSNSHCCTMLNEIQCK